MSQSNSVGLIDLQIMWNRLIAVVEEQAQTLMRTAFSPIVRECGDLSAGVFDLEGRMLAQAVTGTPGHVNSMAESVKHFLRYFPIDDDEARAMPTSPTIRGWAPAISTTSSSSRRRFRHGKLVGAVRLHQPSHRYRRHRLRRRTDRRLRGRPLHPDPKIFDRGKMNETLIDIIRANMRVPVDTEGDIYSLAASNDVGGSRWSP